MNEPTSSLILKDHYEPIYVMLIAAEPSVKGRQTGGDDLEAGRQCITEDKLNTHSTEQRKMHI